MFESIRNHKKYLMGFLMILIIPSFVLFGIEGYTRFNESAETVATVDGQNITKLEWDQAHQTESRRLREAMPSLDASLLDSDQARHATLERLVRQRVLEVAARKLNLYTSDRRLAQDLQANETIATLRRPDGTLDVEAYRTLLGRQGLTPEMYEARVRAELSQRQVAQGIQGTSFTSDALANVSLNAFFERREVRVAQFNAADFAGGVSPTDAEIEAFYNGNAPLFQAPEQVDVEYLVLDTAALEGSVVLNESDLRAYYDQNAARLSGAEERRASHILLTVPQGAAAADKEAVRERANALLTEVRAAPGRFAELAKAHSEDPGSAPEGGDLDFFARGAMVKPFEDAAYALNKGDISDLVETEYGFHIIQLTDIKTPAQRSFEDMRAEIEKDLKRQQVQRLFADSAEAFSNLVYERPDTFEPAAERFKLKVQVARGLVREPGANTGVLANPSLLAAIFSPDSLSLKRNTEAIEIASGQLASARVVLHTPTQTRPLAEVRDSVRQRLVAQRSAALAREEAERKLEAWKSGGNNVGGLGAAVTLSRDNPQGVPPQVLAAALSADPKALPAWLGVSLGEQGHAVVRVDKVLPREPSDAPRLAQEVQQYTQWWSTAEGLAYYDMLKERFKARMLVPEPAAALR